MLGLLAAGLILLAAAALSLFQKSIKD